MTGVGADVIIKDGVVVNVVVTVGGGGNGNLSLL